ncbi:MAG TPA: hypothetical protein PKN48_07000 [Bacteroidales bacterium]|nr:hypothetical protein [Bacteroidales bacterium]
MNANKILWTLLFCYGDLPVSYAEVLKWQHMMIFETESSRKTIKE